MSPPKPFELGTKKNIYSSFSLLNPVLGKLQAPGEEKNLALDIGAPESGYAIEVEGEKARVTFSYTLDNNLIAEDGQFLLKDTFEINLKKKKLLDFHRHIEGGGLGDFWSRASARLGEAKVFTARSREVRDFFSKVILKMSLPLPEQEEVRFVRDLEIESPLMRHDIEDPKIKIDTAALADLFQLHRLTSLSGRALIPSRSNLLVRRDSPIYLSKGQVMMDAQSRYYTESVSSPEMIGALFCGSTAFHFGRALGGTFVFESLWLSRLVSTATGLAFEVPVFEMAGRGVRAFKTGYFEWNDFGNSLFRNYLTFGAFRGANSMSRSPWVAFGTLHGVNEFERSRGILPGKDDDYIHRVMQDGVLFTQLSLSSQIAESTLGRLLGIQAMIPEKIHESQMATFKEMASERKRAEVWVGRGTHSSNSRLDLGRLEKFYFNPDRDSWTLGPLIPEEGFFPDVIAAHEESPSLYVFRNEVGEYFIQRYVDVQGREAIEANYYDADVKLWVPIDGCPIPLKEGIQIRAGQSLYQLDLTHVSKTRKTSVISNPVEVPPEQPSPPSAPIPPMAGTLPIVAPSLKIFYGSALHQLTSPDSMELVLGRRHQASIFRANSAWVAEEHFKIEYVKEQEIWAYKLTALSEEGLSIENQHTGKKRIFRILKKGESLLVGPDDYEIKFKISELEWGDILMLTLPVIEEVSPP